MKLLQPLCGNPKVTLRFFFFLNLLTHGRGPPVTLTGPPTSEDLAGFRPAWLSSGSNDLYSALAMAVLDIWCPLVDPTKRQ